MQGWMSQRSKSLISSAQSPLRRIPTVHINEKDIFDSLWSIGLPVVVDCIPLRGYWTEKDLSETYGEDPCIAIDETGKHIPMTVKDFFELWASDEGTINIRVWSDVLVRRYRIIDLAFQDWPPAGRLADVASELHENFQRFSPFRAKTNANGFENFLAHFPDYVPADGSSWDGLEKPDLGT